MAKTVSNSLLTHMQGEQTTLATLWKLIRKDGQIYGFTDADEDISWNGLTYEAATGFTPSSISTNAGLNVDNLDVEGILSSETITDSDLIAGLWDGSTVEVWKVNKANLTQGGMLMRKGTTGEIEIGRSDYRTELRGLMQPLQQTMGNVYTAPCKANLGDAKCKVNIASYTVTGTVSSVTNNRHFFDSSKTEPNGTYSAGKIFWTSGLNQSRYMEVKTFANAGGEIILQQPMPFPITIGDTFTVSRGCDKKSSTCRDNFSNIINFRGFPFIPGKDKLMGG
jgi:uncharacterized phage protein (TIGR02218 family)